MSSSFLLHISSSAITPPHIIKHTVTKFFLFSSLLLLLLLLSIFSSSPSLLPLPLQQHQQQQQNPHNQYLPLRKNRFLQVPQIVWGLNNQKIALARAALTARFLNRTLLMPQLSASLFYKETDLLQPMPFDRLFSLTRFNALCDGFVAIAPLSAVPPNTTAFNVTKGSGRRWTLHRDAAQLNDCRNPENDEHTVIQFLGKHSFLWHDHWAVRDYARVFECLVLVDDVSSEVDTVVGKLRQTSNSLFHTQFGAQFDETKRRTSSSLDSGLKKLSELQSGNATIEATSPSAAYVAVHMRIEKDWTIHCKKIEDRAFARYNKSLRICVGKEEIVERVSRIRNLLRPSVIYLAVADVLLEDSTLLDGWTPGLVPFEKKRLKVMELYQKYPYIIQSAIDYEVCLRSDVFVGNTFSTFSSLIVLERTMKMVRKGSLNNCGKDLPSYAYNLPQKDGAPQPWIANLSDSSLKAISYGTNHVSCFYR